MKAARPQVSRLGVIQQIRNAPLVAEEPSEDRVPAWACDEAGLTVEKTPPGPALRYG